MSLMAQLRPVGPLLWDKLNMVLKLAMIKLVPSKKTTKIMKKPIFQMAVILLHNI